MCAAWAWHGIRVQPGWAQLVWMSYLSLCFVRKLTSCEFAAEPSIWPRLSGDDSLAERELAGAAALLWRQMLRASPRLSGDHHCFLWAPLCLVVWSVPLITACLPAFSPQAAKALIKFESPSHHSLALWLDAPRGRISVVCAFFPRVSRPFVYLLGVRGLSEWCNSISGALFWSTVVAKVCECFSFMWRNLASSFSPSVETLPLALHSRNQNAMRNVNHNCNQRQKDHHSYSPVTQQSHI